MATVTLRTIAEEAGVSVSTVSLALSGKGHISQQQVERIKGIAEALGYRPNPVLASLASKRFRSGSTFTGTLLALLELRSGGAPKRPVGFYREALLAKCKELGYQVQVYDETRISNYKNLPKTLYNCGVQGVIITGEGPPETFADTSAWEPFSMVQCGRFRSSLPLHTVRSDIYRSVKLIYRHLRELGYERIGFGFGRHGLTLEDDEARLGAAWAINELDDHAAHIPPFMGKLNDDEAFIQWAKDNQPDCIVGFSVGQYFHLLKNGFKIPQTSGFAGMHIGLQDTLACPRFSGLLQQLDVIANQSVVLLDQLIRYNDRGFPTVPQHTLIPSKWVAGETTRKMSQPETGK